jgi:hypothetical protein
MLSRSAVWLADIHDTKNTLQYTIIQMPWHVKEFFAVKFHIALVAILE